MVKDNNELIQRVRMLEKEKNAYYLELKKFGNFGNENKGAVGNQSSKKKAIKGERWSMIEEKIKSIRTENQKLQANFAIN